MKNATQTQAMKNAKTEAERRAILRGRKMSRQRIWMARKGF